VGHDAAQLSTVGHDAAQFSTTIMCVCSLILQGYISVGGILKSKVSYQKWLH
jgi:hypothetical protein